MVRVWLRVSRRQYLDDIFVVQSLDMVFVCTILRHCLCTVAQTLDRVFAAVLRHGLCSAFFIRCTCPVHGKTSSLQIPNGHILSDENKFPISTLSFQTLTQVTEFLFNEKKKAIEVG